MVGGKEGPSWLTIASSCSHGVLMLMVHRHSLSGLKVKQLWQCLAAIVPSAIDCILAWTSLELLYLGMDL